MSVLAGLLILLRSATRITHKAQAVTCLAAKWHACATIDSFDTAEVDTPAVSRMPSSQPACRESSSFSDELSDGDEVGDEEDELDNTLIIPAYAFSTISFQKRQALGQFLLFDLLINYVLKLIHHIQNLTFCNIYY